MAPLVTGCVQQLYRTGKSHDYQNEISKLTDQQQQLADLAMQYSANKSESTNPTGDGSSWMG